MNYFQDAIFRIKQVFNKDFDELFVKKEQEIAKIAEKNKRIKKIIVDLGIIEEVIEPTMGVAEKPETLLTVNDDEVKYIEVVDELNLLDTCFMSAFFTSFYET